MSEQPIQPGYESRKDGAVFDDGNVIDLQKARQGLKSYNEVRASREAEQIAHEAAMRHSVERRDTGEFGVADAQVALSNLNRVRENYLRIA